MECPGFSGVSHQYGTGSGAESGPEADETELTELRIWEKDGFTRPYPVEKES